MATHYTFRGFSGHPLVGYIRLCGVFALLLSTLGAAFSPDTRQADAQGSYGPQFLEPLMVTPQEGAAGTPFTFTARLDPSSYVHGFPFGELHIWEPGEYNPEHVQAPSVDAHKIVLVSGDDLPDATILDMTRILPLYAGAPCGTYTAAIYFADYYTWSAPTTFTISCDGSAQQEPVSETTPGDIEIDLGDGLVLRSERRRVESPGTNCTTEVHVPILTGDSEQVAGFNLAVEHVLATSEISSRLEQCHDSSLPDGITMQNFVTIGVEVIYADSRLISLIFTIVYNIGGGVHPNSFSITLNYDLDADEALSLASLFQPDADYLTLLSRYALSALSQRESYDAEWANEGAGPLVENYQTWNVTPDGLQITFNTYQVAAYAMGPQEVFIPAAELAAIINLDSSVAILWGLTPTEPTPMPVLPADIPDGLVYSAGGQQYLVNLEAKNSISMSAAPPEDSILGPGDARLWMETPGDARVSGNASETFQIVQTRRDGSDQQVLLNSETFFEQFGQFAGGSFSHHSKYVTRQELVLSADATHVFFSVCNPSPELESCGFYQLDLASRSVNAVEGFFGPGWVHPDGQRAISSSKLDCSGALQRDGEPIWLSGTPVSIVWLPDDRFVFSRHICAGIWGSKDVETQYDIILANADGSDDQVLVPGMIASDMALAPDQRTLAFITTDPSAVALWLVNLDGSDLRKVMDLPDDAADLRWYGDASASEGPGEEPTPIEPLAPAPTNGEIAYVHDGNIYLLDLASGETTPLVEDGTVGLVGSYNHTQLAWSPDGQRLAFSSNRAGNYDIYLLDMASGEVEQISTDPLDEYLPAFSPAGTLFFLRIIDPYEGGGIEAYGENDLIMQTASGDEEAVYTLPCEPFSISARSDTEMAVAYGCNLSQGDVGIVATHTPDDAEFADLPHVDVGHVCTGNRVYRASDGKWSHDGSTLAVIGADCAEGDSSGNWRNALFLGDPDNPDADPERILGDQEWLTSLDWSPDDEWLVYAQRTGEWDEWERSLWLVNAESGEPVQISRDGHSPAWRPVAVADEEEEEQGAPASTEAAPASETAVSYILSGRVTDTDGNPVESVVIAGDTCGTTTTDADGNYDLIWYDTESPTCKVRPYEQTVTNDEWGAVFDPPVYTFSAQSVAEQDFVMHSKRRPLIFVPGLMGSMLYEKTNPPAERWPGFTRAGRDRLILGNANLIATDAIRRYTARLLGVEVREVDTYGTLLERLDAEDYAESRMLLYPSTSLEQCAESITLDSPLFVFAYDWRKSNTENANLLADYIQCVRERTGSDYVDVVAHSMGGILTRRYVLENQNNHHIDRFISVATPWLGAPRSIAVIETGQYPTITDNLGGILTTIWAHELKPVAQTSPGPHELLPSEAYFAQFNTLHDDQNSVFEEQGWDYNERDGNEQVYDHMTFIEAFDHRFDSNPGTTNRAFHTVEQDDLNEWYGVDHYNFYGVIDTDATPIQVKTQQTFMCEWRSLAFNAVSRKEIVCANSVDYLKLTLSDGDGTVPVISAVPPPLEEPQECGYNGRHIVRFCGSKEEADHGALVRNDQVLNAIVDILARRAPAPPVAEVGTVENTSLAYSPSFSGLEQQADANAAQPAHYITILNTSSATLADAFGNTTDAISGTLSMPVPNASYYILGEQAHMFVMPASETYTVTLPVGEAPMYMELRTGTGDSSTQAIRYSDQTFPLSTTAMLSISPQGVENLRYDSDGDGTFDTSVEPTVSVSGDNANDSEPPSVRITVDEQDGQWLATIAAEDDGSGVKQVLYSTDNRQYAIYEGPFEVNPNETTTLYAFAEDNVVNRSGVAVYDLERDQQPNWNIWMIISLLLVEVLVVMLIVIGVVLAFKRWGTAEREYA